MNTVPDFTLGFAGSAVALDPAGGTLRVSAAALAAGLGLTLTARDAGGAATAAFRITLTLRDAGAEAVAPASTRAPLLAGAGLVGEPVTLDPGLWSGTPAPALEAAWLRDGAAIPGATGLDYVPVAADDAALIAARVTARNAAGTAEALTEGLRVTRVAPSAIGALPDLALVQGAGFHRVEAGAAFAGEGLGFSVAGFEGAAIDPATGALDLGRAALRDGAVVTVTARNSGGAAEVRFRVTVRAPVAAPAVAGAPGDLLYPLGEGARSVSASAWFTGADLAYALEAAPPGVTIKAGSGLVTIPTAVALDGPVTVRATNAGGSAALSFRVVVRSLATDFSEAALARMSFLHEGAAPAWSFDAAQGFARLVPAPGGRTHGIWAGAGVESGGAGRYRMLARWSAANSTAGGNEPFVFGVGLGRAGGDFTGAYVAAFRPVGSGIKRLKVHEYTGSGAATVERADAVANWVWGTWYWVEVELAGRVLRARYHAEAEVAPDWMIEATLAAAPGSGGFGPGSFPLAGVSPTLLLKRIEFIPPEAGTPAAAQDGDWSLAQVTE